MHQKVSLKHWMSLKLTQLIIEYEHKIIIPIQNLHATELMLNENFQCFYAVFSNDRLSYLSKKKIPQEASKKHKTNQNVHRRAHRMHRIIVWHNFNRISGLEK